MNARVDRLWKLEANGLIAYRGNGSMNRSAPAAAGPWTDRLQGLGANRPIGYRGNEPTSRLAIKTGSEWADRVQRPRTYKLIGYRGLMGPLADRLLEYSTQKPIGYIAHQLRKRLMTPAIHTSRSFTKHSPQICPTLTVPLILQSEKKKKKKNRKPREYC